MARDRQKWPENVVCMRYKEFTHNLTGHLMDEVTGKITLNCCGSTFQYYLTNEFNFPLSDHILLNYMYQNHYNI
jgi:hypothetical protein